MRLTWCLLASLVGLFVLSVSAPRGWEPIARSHGIGDLLAENARTTVASVPPAPTRHVEPLLASMSGTTFVVPSPPLATQAMTDPTTESASVGVPTSIAAPAQAATMSVAPTAEVAVAPVASLPTVETTVETTSEPVAGPAFGEVVMQSPAVVQSPVSAQLESQPEPADETIVKHNTPAVTSDTANQPTSAHITDTPTVPMPVASLPKRSPEYHVPAVLLPGDKALSPQQSAPELASTTETWWPVPEELLADLDRIGSNSPSPYREWAERARQHVGDLAALQSPDVERSGELLDKLRAMTGELETLITQAGEGTLTVNLRRAGHSLTRRLDIWQRIQGIDESTSLAAQQAADPQRLALCLANLDSSSDDYAAIAAWREYLLLDTLKDLVAQPERVQPQERQRLAQRILDRLDRRHLSKHQQQFVSSGPLADLSRELRHWSAEPVDSRDLLAHLEQFERSTLASDAQLVAADYQRLATSPDPAAQELADWLDVHYRNANLRISLSADLINRLVPQQEPRNMYVNERILGHPTRGWSTTRTDMGIRLVPDPHRLRLAFEANGQIASETNTESGPVVVRTSSQSAFRAEREIEIGLGGVRLHPVDVQARTNPRLRWVKSEFDNIPILRGVVQNIARNKHEEAKPAANAEAQRKIAYQVRQQFDSEMGPQLTSFNERLNDRVLEPLHALELQPQMIESSTTSDRLTMRLRLAADSQLAGHSPRPRAPDDNLASFQVHQSLINNLLEQLDLNGRTFSLNDLRQLLSDRFDLNITRELDPAHEELRLTFASQDAIRVVCQDGRIELSIAIAELRTSDDVWRDFVIRVYYKPDFNQPQAPLMRDGTVQLIGRLGARGQLALRGIASKAFPQSKGFQVLPPQFSQNESLASITVTQFDIRDGWIGVALGDAVPAGTSRTARRNAR